MSDWSSHGTELRDSEAVRWYSALDGDAPRSLDEALTALSHAFGGDTRIGAVAPVDELTGEPTALFLAVEGDISSDETWERLVDAHRVYFAPSQTRDETRERLRLVIAEVPDAQSISDINRGWFQH